MGQYIGENLDLGHVAVLQAVSHGCCGCQFCGVDRLPEIIRTHSDCRHAEELSGEQIGQILAFLAGQGLVEMKDHKGRLVVGLTDDGKRCNRITVDFLC